MSKLKFDGHIDRPFPVEILWDDAYHSNKHLYSKEELEIEMCHPILSQNYGKLLYADDEQVVIGHFLHVKMDFEIDCVRDPYRIPTHSIITITDLIANKVIYRRPKVKK